MKTRLKRKREESSPNYLFNRFNKDVFLNILVSYLTTIDLYMFKSAYGTPPSNKISPSHIFECAVHDGNVKIVNWIYLNVLGMYDKNVKYSEIAAGNGCLNVLKWLKQYKFKFDYFKMSWYIQNGTADVSTYVWYINTSSTHFTHSNFNGRLSLIKWSIDECPGSDRSINFSLSRVLKIAIHRLDRECVSFLVSKFPIMCKDSIFYTSIYREFCRYENNNNVIPQWNLMKEFKIPFDDFYLIQYYPTMDSEHRNWIKEQFL